MRRPQSFTVTVCGLAAASVVVLHFDLSDRPVKKQMRLFRLTYHVHLVHALRHLAHIGSLSLAGAFGWSSCLLLGEGKWVGNTGSCRVRTLGRLWSWRLVVGHGIGVRRVDLLRLGVSLLHVDRL